MGHSYCEQVTIKKFRNMAITCLIEGKIEKFNYCIIYDSIYLINISVHYEC